MILMPMLLGILNFVALLLIVGYLCPAQRGMTVLGWLSRGLVTTSLVLAAVALVHFLAALLPHDDMDYCSGTLQCETLKAAEEIIEGKWNFLGGFVMFTLLAIVFAAVDQKLVSRTAKKIYDETVPRV